LFVDGKGYPAKLQEEKGEMPPASMGQEFPLTFAKRKGEEGGNYSSPEREGAFQIPSEHPDEDSR